MESRALRVAVIPDSPADRGYARTMPLINVAVAHGRTLEDARQGLEKAVRQVSAQFGTFIRRVEWAADHDRVTLEGPGVRLEMWVDAREVHAIGDIPVLGALVGGPLGSGLKRILEQTFPKRLT